MADFYIAQGDRTPSIQATLIAPDGKTAQDLTGATVLFRYQRKDGTGPVREGAATNVGAATAGVVKYDWAVGDTVTAGQYHGEWVVTFADGKQATWPNNNYIAIEIKSRLVAPA